MRLDDDPSDGPELVLREAPAAVEPPRRAGGGMLTGMLMLAVLVGRRRPRASTGATGGSAAAGGRRRSERRAAAGAGAAVPEGFGPVPELDASDEFVRALVRQLSSQPASAAWLTSGDLVRALAVSVDKVAIGPGPAKELKPWGQRLSDARFGAATLHINPAELRSLRLVRQRRRRDRPRGRGPGLRRLRPLFQQAFDELGYTNLTFDNRLARALGRLVDTPVQEEDIGVRATSVTFQFVDPELEALSPAQKHMLRWGRGTCGWCSTGYARSRAPPV